MKIAVLTIGQAPRDDIRETYDVFFKDDASVVQHGLLDGLSATKIEQNYGVDAETVRILVSRLHSGDSVKMDHTKVERGLVGKIHSLDQTGFDHVLLLCTAKFPKLQTFEPLLIEPETIIPVLFESLIHDQKAAIVIPLADQARAQEIKWTQSFQYFGCSPYTEPAAAFVELGATLTQEGIRIVLLDCMGYNASIKRSIQENYDGEIYLANEIIFSYLKKKMEASYVKASH